MERMLWDRSGKDGVCWMSLSPSAFPARGSGVPQQEPNYPLPQGWTALGMRENPQVRPGAGGGFLCWNKLIRHHREAFPSA